MTLTPKISTHNFHAFLWHAGFLALAQNFMDVDTIIPAMIIESGGGAVHIGIMTAIMLGGASFSQLLFAPYVSNRPFKKKFLLLGINTRILSLFALGGNPVLPQVKFFWKYFVVHFPFHLYLLFCRGFYKHQLHGHPGKERGRDQAQDFFLGQAIGGRQCCADISFPGKESTDFLCISGKLRRNVLHRGKPLADRLGRFLENQGNGTLCIEN
jgi:hypothetical protein